MKLPLISLEKVFQPGLFHARILAREKKNPFEIGPRWMRSFVPKVFAENFSVVCYSFHVKNSLLKFI